MKAASGSSLPEEIWESIFKFLDDNNQTFKSLSMVSKQFFSITNRLRFSLTIYCETIPFLHHLFERFPNLTSLDISLFSERIDLDALLVEISTFPNLSDIKSLRLSTFPNSYIKSPHLSYRAFNIPEDGLRALSEKMKKLTSLNCSKVNYIDKNHLFLIADCFPLLEELTLTESGLHYPEITRKDDFDDQLLELPKLRKIYLYGKLMVRQSIIDLCKNCNLLQQVKVIDYHSWTRAVLMDF